jgi:hypothetical protein
LRISSGVKVVMKGYESRGDYPRMEYEWYTGMEMADDNERRQRHSGVTDRRVGKKTTSNGSCDAIGAMRRHGHDDH